MAAGRAIWLSILVVGISVQSLVGVVLIVVVVSDGVTKAGSSEASLSLDLNLDLGAHNNSPMLRIRTISQFRAQHGLIEMHCE